MKRWVTVILCTIIMLSCSVTAYAQTGAEISVDETPPEEGSSAVVVQETTGETSSGLQPTEQRMETVGEVPYITKIYEVPANKAVPSLPKEFEQDGYIFVQHEILTREIAGEQDRKEVSKNATSVFDSNDKAKFLADTPKEIPYTENGYKGTLALEVGSISFEEGERKSYGYPINEIREYPNLPSNDASYIDKSVTKNGVTLLLQGIEWEVMATAPTDGGMVPSQYKGIASYSGTGTASKVNSYTVNFCYAGEVEKISLGSLIYTIIYRGELVPQLEVDGPVKKASLFPVIVIAMISILFLGALGMLVWQRIGKDDDLLAEERDEIEDNWLFDSQKNSTEKVEVLPVFQESAEQNRQQADPQSPTPKSTPRPKRTRMPKDVAPLVQRLDEESEEIEE